MKLGRGPRGLALLIALGVMAIVGGVYMAASNFILTLAAPRDAPERRGAPRKSAIGSFKNYADRGSAPPLRADQEAFPVPSLLAAAAGVGHVYNPAEVDGSTRYEALVIESRGHYYPSLAVESVRVAAGLDPFALKLTFGESLQLDDVVIPTDAR